MGTIHHTAILVTGMDGDILTPKNGFTKAHKKAKKLFGPGTVSRVTGLGINGYKSFFVAPTGSKMGWEPQNIHLDKVEEFIEFLETLKYDDGSTSVKFVKVSYGENGLEVFDYRGNELYAEDN